MKLWFVNLHGCDVGCTWYSTQICQSSNSPFSPISAKDVKFQSLGTDICAGLWLCMTWCNTFSPRCRQMQFCWISCASHTSQMTAATNGKCKYRRPNVNAVRTKSRCARKYIDWGPTGLAGLLVDSIYCTACVKLQKGSWGEKKHKAQQFVHGLQVMPSSLPHGGYNYSAPTRQSKASANPQSKSKGSKKYPEALSDLRIVLFWSYCSFMNKGIMTGRKRKITRTFRCASKLTNIEI